MLDLKTGQQKKLLEVKWWRASIAVIGNELLYPDVDRFTLAVIDSGRTTREFIVKAPILVSAVSSNQRWLAVLDAERTLTVFEIMTGNQISAKATTADEWGPIVITNDGSYVYQLLHEGQLTRWDLQTGAVSENALTRLSEMHTRADFMMLANDDKWVVTAGNHGDVGIFERATGKLVCYEQSPAAVFYAEKVWIGGDRLIFTTDTGVMFEGRLVK